MELGADAIDEQARKFGFESEFEVPMMAAVSKFPTDLNKPQTAMSAIGQFDVRATALQMAMVAGGIANDASFLTANFSAEKDLLDNQTLSYESSNVC